MSPTVIVVVVVVVVATNTWQNGVLQIWLFLYFRSLMKIFMSPVVKYFVVGALLVNVQTFYGSQTMGLLSCFNHTLDEYLSLVD